MFKISDMSTSNSVSVSVGNVIAISDSIPDDIKYVEKLKMKASIVPDSAIPALGSKLNDVISRRSPWISQVARTFPANEYETLVAKCDMVIRDLERAADDAGTVMQDLAIGAASSRGERQPASQLAEIAVNTFTGGAGSTALGSMMASYPHLGKGANHHSDSEAYLSYLTKMKDRLADFRFIMDPDRSAHSDDSPLGSIGFEEAGVWLGPLNAQSANVIVLEDTAPSAATDYTQIDADLVSCNYDDSTLQLTIAEYLSEAAVARTTGTAATDVLGWTNRVANATLLQENTAGTTFRGFAGVRKMDKLAGFWVLSSTASGTMTLTDESVFSISRPSSDSRSAVLRFDFPVAYDVRLEGNVFLAATAITKNTARMSRAYSDTRAGTLTVSVGYLSGSDVIPLKTALTIGNGIGSQPGFSVEVPLINANTTVVMSIGQHSGATADVPMLVSFEKFISDGHSGAPILKDGGEAAGKLASHAGSFKPEALKSVVPHMSTIKDVLRLAKAADHYYSRGSVSASLQSIVRNGMPDNDNLDAFVPDRGLFSIEHMLCGRSDGESQLQWGDLYRPRS